MSKELLPCPFCGSEDIEYDYPIDGEVKCHNCGIEVDCTVEQWNKRLPSHNKDYAKCKSEIMHAVRTLAYPEPTIENVLKKHFA